MLNVCLFEFKAYLIVGSFEAVTGHAARPVWQRSGACRRRKRPKALLRQPELLATLPVSLSSYHSVRMIDRHVGREAENLRDKHDEKRLQDCHPFKVERGRIDDIMRMHQRIFKIHGCEGESNQMTGVGGQYPTCIYLGICWSSTVQPHTLVGTSISTNEPEPEQRT